MSLRSGLVSSKVPLLVRALDRQVWWFCPGAIQPSVHGRVVARAVRDPVTSRSVGSCYMTRAAQLLLVPSCRAARPNTYIFRVAGTGIDEKRIRTLTYRGRPCPTPGGSAAVIPVDPAYRGARPAGRCISAPDTRRPLSLVRCARLWTHKPFVARSRRAAARRPRAPRAGGPVSTDASAARRRR